MSEKRPGFLGDAAGIVDDAWDRLAEGAARGRHAFHTPVLATLDVGGGPTARTVVLRGASRADRRLLCHSDARAPKVLGLLERPAAAWVFYDAAAKVQVRASTRVTVHRFDALADRQWEATGASSRRCYLAAAPPGVATADGGPSPNLPPAVRGRVPEPEETLAGRGRFAVIAAEVLALDVLHLHHEGHRRVRIRYGEELPEPAFVEP
ncbi:pyridoxamine 5'-phosphate oxidase family protein [Phycisphaera mikurensis]|uniref:Pyridoxamine 5'-phosphate oxidase Alr4036 family FMN-binding domain-containing protein n=1 Tax=Phycisphaera mikurensis (strain NBRC 102666 / KCTC 22515 / FYK2301M01) TaxID=1142394 RepID=I0IAK2_PHYMF|nr:pyridoxamine 5'-phosphate oxidase family protein [Phycisphaera mikurensis]MBB6441714.1 hypothetical protein [Phycisphaera mikurensis]BAM02290.1 hypothetical protein PSMK_01310 [Phycisphaera mikurensis NBRC 102666]